MVKICDELWYIYASEEVRRKRLKSSRGYSDEKIDSIFASQLKEAEYRRHCKEVIDNDGDIENTIASINKALKQIQGVVEMNNVFGLDMVQKCCRNCRLSD